MLIPKLFRWIFFKRSTVQNVFDAARCANAKYLNVSLDIEITNQSIPNSSRLDNTNLEEFISKTPKDTILILYGTPKHRRMKIYDQLKSESFLNVFDAGSSQDLKDVLQSI